MLEMLDFTIHIGSTPTFSICISTLPTQYTMFMTNNNMTTTNMTTTWHVHVHAITSYYTHNQRVWNGGFNMKRFLVQFLKNKKSGNNCMLATVLYSQNIGGKRMP